MALWAVTGRMQRSCRRNVPPRGALGRLCSMSVSILDKFGDLCLLSCLFLEWICSLHYFRIFIKAPAAGLMGLHKSCFCYSENQRKTQVHVVSVEGFKVWPKPEVKHGDNVSLFLLSRPPSSLWSIVLTALGDGKCLALAAVLLDAMKGQDKGSSWRGSLWGKRFHKGAGALFTECSELSLWIKTSGFCNASYWVQPHKGLRIKQMLLHNLLRRAWKHSLSWEEGECAQLNVTTSRA